jgi:hypothetical protein
MVMLKQPRGQRGAGEDGVEDRRSGPRDGDQLGRASHGAAAFQLARLSDYQSVAALRFDFHHGQVNEQ